MIDTGRTEDYGIGHVGSIFKAIKEEMTEKDLKKLIFNMKTDHNYCDLIWWITNLMLVWKDCLQHV